MRRSTLRAGLVLVLALGCWSLAGADIVRHRLAAGVVYEQETVPAPAGPLVWSVLRVDPKAPGVRVQSALGRDVMMTDEPAKGRECVAELAKRRGALAAINADFFPYTGRPLGLTIVDGELVAEGLAYRAVIGLGADGQARFDRLLAVGAVRAGEGMVEGLGGVNRLPEKGEITLLMPVFGARTRAAQAMVVAELGTLTGKLQAGMPLDGVVTKVGPGDTNALLAAGAAALVGEGAGGAWLSEHLKVGDKVSVRFDLVSAPDASAQRRGELASRAASLRGRMETSAWADVSQCVGGGPWLVRDGKVAVDGAEEGFSIKGFVEARHPRTAVGVTASGELLLVVVDGRQTFSKGASLPELARHMIALGATQAINLDGGGSSSMVVRDLYVNGPSDGAPRAVANALLVFAAPATGVLSTQDGGAVGFEAGGRAPIETPDGDWLFGTVEGRAFVDQSGVLSSTRASSGTVLALNGDAALRASYRIRAGAPTRLTAVLGKAPNDPPDRSALTARVVDAYGNGVAGQRVRFSAAGGVPDASERVTDDEGKAIVEVVWDREDGRSATVRCGDLKPATARPQ